MRRRTPTCLNAINLRLIMAPWLILGLVLFLVACGGGGNAKPATERTLQLFGDSTQRNMAPLFVARFGARVESRAVGSTTTQMLLDGTDGKNPPWPGACTADVVMVNHGLNDAGTVLHVALDQYRANLRRLASAPTLVVFETPNPIDPLQASPAAQGIDVDVYADAVRQVGAELGVRVIDVHRYVLSLQDWRDHIPDGVHPDQVLMARIFNECVLPGLADLVA